MVIISEAKDAANLPAATLKRLSLLDQKTFDSSLRQLRQAMEQTNPQAALAPATLAAITAKLRRTGESAPSYWPTVLRFIQFSSSRSALLAPPPGEKPRALSAIVWVGLMRGIHEERRSILFDEGNLENGEFTNCRIIFTQHPVRLLRCTFRHCVFEFPATDSPGPFLQKAGRLLLFSNLDSVSVPNL